MKVELKNAKNPLELKEVFDLNEEIGSGSYGVVKKVLLHGTVCAAKDTHAILVNHVGKKQFEGIQKSFLEECIKCSKLFHPNIVQFLGIHNPSKDAKLPWLIMELLYCNLTNLMKNYDKESISLFVKASIFCDISLGLQFLHGQDIIHRDLSSNNILLTKHLSAKIADLGVAKLVDPDSLSSHTVAPGTQIFMPPEVLSNTPKSKYGKSVDVFSLGCVMIHAITHEWPVPAPEAHYDEKLKKKVVLSEVERREMYLNKILKLPNVKDIILKCLHDHSKERPTIEYIVKDLKELQATCQYQSIGDNAVEFEMYLKRTTHEQLLAKNSEIERLQKTNKRLRSLQVCEGCVAIKILWQ